MIGVPYDWCAELARTDDDVLGTALAQVKRPPSVASVRHLRVRETHAGDLERWHLFVAVVFESDDDANDPEMIERTHWQFADRLAKQCAVFSGAYPFIERFARADRRLRAYHRPREGVELPLPPPRPAAVIVAPPVKRSAKETSTDEPAAATPPEHVPPAPTKQGSLF